MTVIGLILAFVAQPPQICSFPPGARYTAGAPAAFVATATSCTADRVFSDGFDDRIFAGWFDHQ